MDNMTKDKKVKSKEEKVDKVHQELEIVKGMLARTLADYDNLSKRIERERTDLGKIVLTGIVTNLLPVLDNLELTQAHLQDPGLAISIVEFRRVLGDLGLTEIKPEIGDLFNENIMEALEVVDARSDNNNSGEAKIAEVMLTGWKFTDGTVVRHAKVKVSKNN
jgi:molecular chaperone GrpE